MAHKLSHRHDRHRDRSYDRHRDRNHDRERSPPPRRVSIRSDIDSIKYHTDSSSSRYYPSSYSDSYYSPPHDAGAIWPSYDTSSTYSKRPSQALYSYSSLGAHILGQSEAWLTPDSLAKRPKLKSACLPVYPQRPGEKDCAHYMLTRTCRFGETCRFDHPIWVPDGGIPDWKEIQLPPVSTEFHPERPGEPDCPYFLKTQNCKFGLNCKYNHPKEKLSSSLKTDAADLPERPSAPQCSFYVKTGKCRFGPACKFHHPKDIEVPSDGQEATNKEPSRSSGNGYRTNDENEVKTLSFDPSPSVNSKGLPIRLGEADCPFYLKTGSCKYAANCRYNHPDRNDINPPAAVFGPGPVSYPQRLGQPECDHYMKAGVCKYEETCKFHHPIDRSTPKLTLAGYPRREGAENCSFYMKTGTCRFGPTCRFDHPPPGEVMALAGEETKAAVQEAKQNEENSDSGGE